MNSNEKDIIYTAIDIFHKNLPGIETHIQSEEEKLEISYQEHHYEFELIVRNNLTNRSAFNTLIKALSTKKHENPVLLIAEYLTKSLAYLLKNDRIYFIDTSGNMFVQTRNFFVFVLDRFPSQRKGSDKLDRLFHPAGLKLIFHALISPQILGQNQRDIAEMSGISLGSVSQVLGDLKTLDFLGSFENGERKLINKARLVERWIDGYALYLRPGLLKGRYRFADRSMLRKWQNCQLERLPGSFWGGEAAADVYTDYVHPEQLTIYTDDTILDVIRTLKLIPDENGPVEILKIFWDVDSYQKDSFLSFAHHANTPVVPLFLIYADLVLSQNSRNFEVANMLYEKHLSHLF